MTRATNTRQSTTNHLDAALAVDDLDEFLPATSGLESDALAVNSLDEFFSADDFPAPDVVTEAVPVAAPSATLQANVFDDYFGDGDETRDSEALAGDIHESDAAPAEGDDVHSDIQRAAIEFQRFAEKFHAFATECQARL